MHGTLYGTAQQAGLSGNGTIFSVSTSGAYHQLYSFGANPDSSTPYATLLDVNGTLYGTSYAGGAPGSDGTVYSFSP